MFFLIECDCIVYTHSDLEFEAVIRILLLEIEEDSFDLLSYEITNTVIQSWYAGFHVRNLNGNSMLCISTNFWVLCAPKTKIVIIWLVQP